MEFIYTDIERVELGYITNASIDIVSSKYSNADNDFSLTIPILHKDPKFDVGSLFYCDRTEWGGLIDKIKVNTADSSVELRGPTYRGLLEKEYIQPPEGEAYLILKGKAHECLNQLIADRFGDLFEVVSSNITIDYKVRDMNLLQAIEKSLGNSNAKLEIEILHGKAYLKATPIQDLSETTRYDNDYQVYMTVETHSTQYNHVLALGIGQLTERMRLNLYLQEDGTWSDVEYYSGLDRKTYKYDNSNIDSLDELRTSAIDAVKSANETNKLSLSLKGDDVALFDIVGAREEITNIEFKEQVTQKILKGSIGSLKVSYKVGEDATTYSAKTETSASGGSGGGGSGIYFGDEGDIETAPLNADQLNGKSGEYYTRPYNLLDNSDFRNPVNQRGATSYTGSQYTIDRWRTCQASTSHELTSKGIKVSGTSATMHSLQTSLLNPTQYVGKTLTLAVYISENNEPTDLQMGIFFGAKSNNQTAWGGLSKTIQAGTTGLVVVSGVMSDMGEYVCANPCIRSRNATGNYTVQWMALYEGEYTAETLPPYLPKGYANELHECQRYFYGTNTVNAQLSWYGYAYTTTEARITVPIGVNMRNIPNVSIGSLGSLLIFVGNGSTATVSSVVGTALTPNGITLRLGTSGLTANYPVMIKVNSTFSFSADL